MASTQSCGGAPPPPSSCGSGAAEPQEDGLFGAGDLSQKRVLHRNLKFLAASGAFCAVSGLIYLTSTPGTLYHTSYIVVALIGVALGYPLLWNAAKSAARLQLKTEVFISFALITVLLIQSWWYASWVVVVIWLAETLMSWAGLRSRSAIEALLQLVPKQARVVGADGSTTLVPIEKVEVGQVVAVQPGDSMPVDGEVIRGDTTVDQSMLTGESLPVDVEVGDKVFAGTHNLVGAVRVRTTTIANENTVAQIVTMMRKAQADQIPIPKTVDRFIRWFFPLALLLGLVVFAMTGEFVRLAAILLVLAPCAFSAATPLALVSTIGNSSRYGVLVKNSQAIEALPRARVALLDKTGTLTTSTPVLDAVEAVGLPEPELLRLAATAENAVSSHPLARAVIDAAAERGIQVAEPDAAEIVTGNGVVATVSGRRVVVGNERFINRFDHVIPAELEDRARRSMHEGHTLAYVAIDGEVRGFLGFLALPRPAAREVVDGLRRYGFQHLVMLTGDQSRPAQAIADRLGIEVVSEATPEAKLHEVSRWKNDKSHGGTVLMVGDGINDAGGLAAADVGIAMGSTGAEVAAAAADIVVHGDRFSRVLTAAKLARHGLRMIRVNIAFAFVPNTIGLVFATLGLLTPLQAQVVHMSAFFLVVFNSMAVLLYRPKVIHDESVAAVAPTSPATVPTTSDFTTTPA